MGGVRGWGAWLGCVRGVSMASAVGAPHAPNPTWPHCPPTACPLALGRCGGMMNNDPVHNPLTYDWNKVLIRYLSAVVAS